MTDTAAIADRLAALPRLEGVPRSELEWLAAEGRVVALEAGTRVAEKGRPIDKLWIQLSGRTVLHVDRGAGPRRVIEWSAGDVSGLLPYSRMTSPPGDNMVEVRCELLAIDRSRFPEMIQHCPLFTAHTVHVMLDRARSFNSSDLHDEKMVSLGKLAAGLAHELNNPASATVRAAKQLRGMLERADDASRTLGAAGLSKEQAASIAQVREACARRPTTAVLSPIEQADREDAIAEWLDRHHVSTVHAAPLADTAVALETLDALAAVTSAATLDAAIGWIAAGCATQSLAQDIEQAATRIHDLVASVKRFTYMDTAAGPDSMDLVPGLRDTIRVVAAKARARGASVSLDAAPDLPRVRAIGSELNQVWLNLIDNALDAVEAGGHVEIIARAELDRVVVRVVDDGTGIAPDVLPRIFDPFFTTKPPGQGTGLGLEITRRLLRQSQADIGVESRPGRTEFRVSIPTG